MPKNAIDHLWDMEAAELTNENIDDIIAYQIKLLQGYESGVKPKREAEEQIDFTQIVASIVKKTTGTAPAKPAKKSGFIRRI